MNNWETSTEDSKIRWEANANFWDDKMGEHSNRFHREIVRPSTEALLDVHEGENILDIVSSKWN
jgi:hypothetical protein